MKSLFLECNMGVSGDMLCGALLDIAENRDEIIKKLNNIGFCGVKVSAKSDTKCSIKGTKFNVSIDEKNFDCNKIEDIYSIIDSFNIDDKTKNDAKAVYTLIAKAESKVHGVDVAQVHLHEVGAKDAIMDVTACAYIINSIGIDKIVASPITTGFGYVKCAHGVLSVPAPATAILLEGIPNRRGNIEGELCTPTGSALIKYFADDFTNDFNGTYTAVGYGMGSKNFEQPNCVRAFLCDDKNEEVVYELKCQLDDMTGEEMGFCINKLIVLGANDAFVQPITMKKSRPAMLLTVISTADKCDLMTQAIFKHTTTLGIRKNKCTRNILSREIIQNGEVHIKRSQNDFVQKEKIEFDDLAKYANDNNISIFEAKNALLKP